MADPLGKMASRDFFSFVPRESLIDRWLIAPKFVGPNGRHKG